jgi:hypothetical protein
MLINDSVKLERSDDRNITFFEKSEKGNWNRSGMYWPNFEKAVKGVLQIFTIDQITFVGDLQEVMREIKSFRDRLGEIEKKILSQGNVEALEALRHENQTLKNEIQKIKEET